MAEVPSLHMINVSTNTLLVNPEAHTSLQLLHRVSSDEDEDEDEDEQDIIEIEDDEEEEEDGDDPLVEHLNHDSIDKSPTSPKLSPLLSKPFPLGRGRGLLGISPVKILEFFVW